VLAALVEAARRQLGRELVSVDGEGGRVRRVSDALAELEAGYVPQEVLPWPRAGVECDGHHGAVQDAIRGLLALQAYAGAAHEARAVALPHREVDAYSEALRRHRRQHRGHSGGALGEAARALHGHGAHVAAARDRIAPVGVVERRQHGLRLLGLGERSHPRAGVVCRRGRAIRRGSAAAKG